MKIGILTHYYKSKNYGGLLQAYALVNFLKRNGFDAEQISYQVLFLPFTEINTNIKKDTTQNNKQKIKIYDYLHILKKKILKIFPILTFYSHYLFYWYYLKFYSKKRLNSFIKFQNLISHSNDIYNSRNIKNACEYDIYITGSDQVWNFNWFNPSFFLDFVPNNKKKIAYAASAGQIEFNKMELTYLKERLSSFDFLSVRELDLKNTLKEKFNLKVEHVVDPVLLLNKEEWSNLANKRIVKYKYIFCYFLGNEKKSRVLATQYAKKKNYKIVQIPYLFGFNEMDCFWGDKKIYTAGPLDFVSLIKYSECVFTDSFHASVLSIIFQKQFFVFHRDRTKSMSSRLESILNFIDCYSNFCGTEEKNNLNYLLNFKPIDYDKLKIKLDNWISYSKEILLNQLQK